MKYILFKDNFGKCKYQAPYRIIYTDSINIKDIYMNIIQKYSINNKKIPYVIKDICDKETTLNNLHTDLSYSIIPISGQSDYYNVAIDNIYNVFKELHAVESDMYSIGGYVDNPDVLSQEDNCVILTPSSCKHGTQIKGNAIVGYTTINGNVTISDNSIIWTTDIFSNDRNDININGNAVIISSRLKFQNPLGAAINISDTHIQGCRIMEGNNNVQSSLFISGYSYLYYINIFNHSANTIKLHNTILENHCENIQISINCHQFVSLIGLTFVLNESNKQKYLEFFQEYAGIYENQNVISCDVLSKNLSHHIYYVRLDDFINYF
jgi:hypothetical protein